MIITTLWDNLPTKYTWLHKRDSKTDVIIHKSLEISPTCILTRQKNDKIKQKMKTRLNLLHFKREEKEIPKLWEIISTTEC